MHSRCLRTVARTEDNRTCLELAIKRHLVAVVDQMCKHGAAVNEVDETGDCPLWQALDTGQEDIASVLVGGRTGLGCTKWGWGVWGFTRGACRGSGADEYLGGG